MKVDGPIKVRSQWVVYVHLSANTTQHYQFKTKREAHAFKENKQNNFWPATLD